MENIIIAFILTCLAGLSTLIGTFFIFYKGDIKTLTKYALSFAAGVMLCVSIVDLIPEALNELVKSNNKITTFTLTTLFIGVGIIISYLIDKLIPENKNIGNKQLYHLGIFAMLAIIIHNVPEGIATFLSSTTNIALGLSLTIAIAIHNIPEGISISIPIYSATGSKKRAFGYTLISAFAEPLGAILAFLFLKDILTNTIMGCTLAIIAGIMTYIALLQFLPEALKYKEKKKTMFFFIVGMLFMLFSLYIMN